MPRTLPPLLALALLALAGCATYEGPNYGGVWDGVGAVGSAKQTLTLAHDPDAWLDWELTGTFVDAAGTEWEIEADPEEELVVNERVSHPPEARGQWRVTLRGGLTVVDDEGQRAELDVGPILWILFPGVRWDGTTHREQLELVVAPVQRALGVDPPEAAPRNLTFARRGLSPTPPAGPPPGQRLEREGRCTGCGEPLDARWQVCPVCAKPVRIGKQG